MSNYTIALYIRLSVNDKRVESNSIEHQKLLLTKYAENMEIQNIKLLGGILKQILQEITTEKRNILSNKKTKKVGCYHAKMGIK